MNYTLAASVNSNLSALLIVPLVFVIIGFFIGRKVFSRFDQQSRVTINVYAVLFGLAFSMLITLVILFFLSGLI